MLLHQLQRASFRGVPFLVPDDKLDEGRHVVMHEYPDSNQRYAEDNGRDTPIFNVSAIVAEPGLPGKLSALRRALAAEGPGTLKHPWAGSQFVQVDKVSIKRSDKNGGYVELEIKFVTTGPPQFPGLISSIPAAVSALVSSAIVDIFKQFVLDFGDPTSISTPPSAIPSIPGLVNALSATSFSVITTAFEPFAETLQLLAPASFAATVFEERIGELIANPVLLSDVLTTALRAPLTTDDSIPSRQLVNAYAELSDAAVAVSDLAESIQPTTLDLGNRKTALAILSGYIQAAVFINLAEAVAVTTYDTADDVERVETLLTNHAELLQERDLSTVVRAALTDIYVAASEVLRDAAVRLPRLVTVSAFNTPASVLAYMLYEDRFEAGTEQIVEDRAAALIKLNLNETPLLFPGEVTVLMREA